MSVVVPVKTKQRTEERKMTEKYKNDYEEDDDSIDESQVDFLKKKQRELITSTIDYTEVSRFFYKADIANAIID